MPLHHQHTPVVRHEWDTKSKSRIKPPQTVYQKSRIAHKVNYGNGNHHTHQNHIDMVGFDGEIGPLDR
jgi:hypothetical protein